MEENVLINISFEYNLKKNESRLFHLFCSTIMDSVIQVKNSSAELLFLIRPQNDAKRGIHVDLASPK